MYFGLEGHTSLVGSHFKALVVKDIVSVVCCWTFHEIVPWLDMEYNRGSMIMPQEVVYKLLRVLPGC